jgi:hypothetical protein
VLEATTRASYDWLDVGLEVTMPRLMYRSQGRTLSSAGTLTVTHDDRVLATVSATSGGFLRGPTWVWVAEDGDGWTLDCTRSDRFYELRRADGSVAARLTRRFASSGLLLESDDGQHGTVAPRRPLTKVHHVALPGGVASVTRHSGSLNLGRSETWALDAETGVASGSMYLALLALPITLDHRRRRQRQGGGGAA